MGQIQGFFDIPVDDLTSRLVFAKDIKRKIIKKLEEPVIFVSPRWYSKSKKVCRYVSRPCYC